MKVNIFRSIFIFLLVLPLGDAQGQKTNNLIVARAESVKPGSVFLKWADKVTVKGNDNTTEHTYISFEGALHDASKNNLPYFFERKQISDNAVTGIKAEIIDAIYKPFTEAELSGIKGLEKIEEKVVVTSKIAIERKQPFYEVTFIPIRFNKATSTYEKIVSFSLRLTYEKSAAARSSRGADSYAAQSVLANGTWYKIAVTKDGIYKMDHKFLTSIGVDPLTVNPANVQVFGNPAGMLPEKNSDFFPDDLTEYAISVTGASDGVFNADDLILFYGQSAHRWFYNNSNQRFEHKLHLYSDTTFYFISFDRGMGKRIPTQASVSSPANVAVTSFDDYAFHEKEFVNYIKSGRTWFGETFDAVTTYNYTFSFPDIDFTSPVIINTSVAARSPEISTFTLSSGNNNSIITLGNISPANYQGVQFTQSSQAMQLTPTSNNIDLTLTYNKPANSKGWLNYLEVNARRNLRMSGDQMLFRDIKSVGPGNIAEYIIDNAQQISVWDVTDPQNVTLINSTIASGKLSFRLPADTLKEFLAFTGLSYLDPVSAGKIENQNLHGLPQTQMVIVTHPMFKAQANELADFHREEGLTVEVATTSQVYNEFSGGQTDLCAIRNFMRMFYERGASLDQLPQYLLLYGDGSYNNKGGLTANTAFIPTYQSEESSNVSQSYVSDDFFGFLDPMEGDWSGSVDVGIGRLPVKNVVEAKNVLHKIKNYRTAATMKNWRNVLCFVADDEDSNIHISDADALATMVEANYPSFNLEKIYFDSYKQQSTPGGQRYPDVNEAINRRVEKGALIINYTGHGGELGWAHESVLTVPQINAWRNINNLPLFFTATCEFSRFDDPGRTSAGEYVLLNNEGGAIALFTTVRLVFSGQNSALNTHFYNNVFKEINGEMPRMGDVFRNTKNAMGSDLNARNFTLLGDPALRLAYPEKSVSTTTINAKTVVTVTDTLKALSKVTVTGFLADKAGSKISDFNGIIYPTVYDKKSNLQTLSNDPGSPPKNFSLWKNIIYRGKASVKNGDFTFTFIVPKDIAYTYGAGRISYYAENGTIDAHGYNENFYVGGTADSAAIDNTGPTAEAYMNDKKFIFGGMTDENPTLAGYLFDENGINTTGSGIGHDITAILDGNTEKTIMLNDYYEADLDSYQSGIVKYPFKKLTPGTHTLKLKAWDVYNNSTEAYTEFVVANSAKLALDHVLNYPNPFTTYTEFYFEHNQPSTRLDVQIQIYTVSGRLIKTIDADINTEGYRGEPIPWNGLDDYGDKIGRGVYVYRLKVRSSDGSLAEKYEKLVILN